ncbi:MAG: hypothetical protein LDL11_01175 [Desulfarculus sp.]|nr:hypothetical protein [Desulfarculus sp.]
MTRLLSTLLLILCLSPAALAAASDFPSQFARAQEARQAGDPARAAAILSQLAKRSGLGKEKLSEVLVLRGVVWQEMHEFYRAISDFARAVELTPNWPEPHNNLAWVLATCWNPDYRNGELALNHAQKADQLLPDNPDVLDTLAAAYAEVGRFDQAVATQERSLGLLEKQGRREALEQARLRLSYYQAQKPWRDQTPPRL